MFGKLGTRQYPILFCDYSLLLRLHYCSTDILHSERADTASSPIVIDLGAKYVDGYAKFAFASCG